MFCKWFISALCDLLCNEVLNYNAEFSTIEQFYETAQMVEEASCYNHRMQCIDSAHTAASNTKPAAYKAQLLMSQMTAVVGRENMVHCGQTMHAYNALKPEQRFVQEKDSLTKPSVKNWVTQSLTLEVLCLMVDVVGGTWLQLMCCTLPRCLCP